MSARRQAAKTVARFDPNSGPIADYTLTARRPATPREDPERDEAKAAWTSQTHRQVTLIVPMLAQADQYQPPQFVESRIELGEDGARELIDQLQALLDWMREPYPESEAE